MTNIYEENLESILYGNQKLIEMYKNTDLFRKKLLEVEYGYVMKFMENHRKEFGGKIIKKLIRLLRGFAVLNGNMNSSDEKILSALNVYYVTYVLN